MGCNIDIGRGNRDTRRSLKSAGNPYRQQLFQIVVETSEDELLPVFPRMMKETCERLVEKINQGIILGREVHWRNPHIVPAKGF